LEIGVRTEGVVRSELALWDLHSVKMVLAKGMLRHAAAPACGGFGQFDGMAPPELWVQLNVLGDVDSAAVWKVSDSVRNLSLWRALIVRHNSLPYSTRIYGARL